MRTCSTNNFCHLAEASDRYSDLAHRFLYYIIENIWFCRVKSVIIFKPNLINCLSPCIRYIYMLRLSRLSFVPCMANTTYGLYGRLAAGWMMAITICCEFLQCCCCCCWGCLQNYWMRNSPQTLLCSHTFTPMLHTHMLSTLTCITSITTHSACSRSRGEGKCRRKSGDVNWSRGVRKHARASRSRSYVNTPRSTQHNAPCVVYI